MENWLEPYLIGMTRLDQLQRLQLAELLRHYLTAQKMRELDRLAPSHLQVPSGSSIAIEYGRETHPVLSVKLQELFGLLETPLVAAGTIPVTIHLLSPAARPLAVTQDLPSFWQKVYPDIRKQLRARYPKHPWPEDPLTAAPTKKTVRQLSRRQ
jgi:ATP-dependent helicase HrpB